MADAPARPRMEVLFCANSGYFQHLAVAAVSLAANNRQTPVRIHVLTCDRDAQAEARLRQSLAAFPGVELNLQFVDGARMARFFVDGYLTRECYLRLLAPDLLEASAERLIYLDCDLVVADDLLPLWQMDLDGNLLAAAPNYPLFARQPGFDAGGGRQPEIVQDEDYVNSGVLLIDAKAWRQEGISERIAAYIQDMGGRLVYHDQDAINGFLPRRIKRIPPRWNLQAQMYYISPKAMPRDVLATRSARANPAVIHYAGAAKPWHFRARVAQKGPYFRYLAMTAWANAASDAPDGKLRRLERRLDRTLARRFGVDYMQGLHKLRQARARLAGLFARMPGTKRTPQRFGR